MTDKIEKMDAEELLNLLSEEHEGMYRCIDPSNREQHARNAGAVGAEFLSRLRRGEAAEEAIKFVLDPTVNCNQGNGCKCKRCKAIRKYDALCKEATDGTVE